MGGVTREVLWMGRTAWGPLFSRVADTGAGHTHRAAATILPLPSGLQATTPPARELATLRPTDRSIRVVVDWSPSERIRGALPQVADAENNVIGASPPRKIDVNRGSTLRST